MTSMTKERLENLVAMIGILKEGEESLRGARQSLQEKARAMRNHPGKDLYNFLRTQIDALIVAEEKFRTVRQDLESEARPLNIKIHFGITEDVPY